MAQNTTTPTNVIVIREAYTDMAAHVVLGVREDLEAIVAKLYGGPGVTLDIQFDGFTVTDSDGVREFYADTHLAKLA